MHQKLLIDLSDAKVAKPEGNGHPKKFIPAAAVSPSGQQPKRVPAQPPIRGGRVAKPEPDSKETECHADVSLSL